MRGNDIFSQVRGHGQRLTAQRRAVIEVIMATSQRLTPADVYRRARRRHPGVGLATVYRTLELLAELGAVERLHEPEGCHSFVADQSAGTHHHHLVCSSCGRVAEIPACDLGEQLRSVAAQSGFEVDAHWLELRGLCPACRTAARPGSSAEAPRATTQSGRPTLE